MLRDENRDRVEDVSRVEMFKGFKKVEKCTGVVRGELLNTSRVEKVLRVGGLKKCKRV